MSTSYLKAERVKWPYNTVSALGSPTALCPHTWVPDSLNHGAELSCGIRACVELHKQLCWHSAVDGLRKGASSPDLCAIVKYKHPVKLANICCLSLYPLPEHAVFFLTNETGYLLV